MLTMSTVVVEIAYDGEALARGSMDVEELAPALLAIGDMCREANRVLNGDSARVSLRVRSDFKTGSFQVNLEVAQTILEQARSLIMSDSVTAALQLATILGLLKGGQVGLLRLIKWLKGQKPDRVNKLPDGQIQIVKIDIHTHVEETIIISELVARVFEEKAVREAARRTLKPLEFPGIDTFEVRENGVPFEIITTKEVPYFDPPAPVTAGETPLAEDTREAAFEIVRPAFEDRFKWTLTDGKSTFNVDLEDIAFLKRIEAGLKFAKHDVIKVRLKTESHRTPAGRLITEYKVVEVMEIIPAPRQATLFDHIDDRPGDSPED
jgi:hypothetical protein